MTRQETAPTALPRPFVKWVGGKSRVVPTLLRTAPRRFGRYHEPFVGGGAFYWALHNQGRLRHGATLTDVNLRLVRTWRAVQGPVDRLIARLAQLAAAHDKEHYYEVRAWDVDSFEDDVEVAAWFIYLNKTGFNGLYRVNSKNGFNVPMGRYSNPRVCDPVTLRACHEALQGVELRHGAFDDVATQAERGDLVYFDPPYVPLTKTASFTAYSKAGFGPEQQERLAVVAQGLKDRGVHVILSNHDTPVVRGLYNPRGFKRRTIQVSRPVSSAAGKRGKVDEVVFWSPRKP